MGADLILATWWTTKPEELDWSKGVTAISALTIEDCPELDFFELDDTADGEDEAESLERIIRPQLLRDLDEIKCSWEGRHRDSDVYQFGPVRVLLSGGTSWGDDPSDMFTAMTRIPESVAEAIGFFV